MALRMNILRGSLIALVCASSIGSEVRSAHAMTMAQVTALEVNVREAPHADAPITTKLPQGAFVVVEGVQGDWARIMYIPDRTNYHDVRRGWIATRFLVLVQGNGSGGTYKTSGGATFKLSADSSDIDCDEGLDGYNSCEVSVSFSYDSDYNGSTDPRPDIRCEADIEATAGDGSSTNLSDYETTTEYGRRGSGNIDIDFPFSSYQRIARVIIENVECEITGVSE